MPELAYVYIRNSLRHGTGAKRRATPDANENGAQSPAFISPKMARKPADALGVDPEELFS